MSGTRWCPRYTSSWRGIFVQEIFHRHELVRRSKGRTFVPTARTRRCREECCWTTSGPKNEVLCFRELPLVSACFPLSP